MNWTLTQLRALVAVADHGTMTSAAKHLGYTTGAVSQHVAALQRVTGTQLFSPRGRRVELTRAGHALLPRARQVLAADAQAADALRGADLLEAHALSLGVFGSASVVAFQPVVELLAGHGVDIRAFEVDVEKMQEAVLSGRIDVGIGIDYPASPLAPQRGIEMLGLRTERFSAIGSAAQAEALAPGDALARAGGAAPAGTTPGAGVREALADAPWILAPNDSTFGRALRFACADLGITPIEKHIVTDTAVALAMAAAGTGLTLATPIMMELGPPGAAVLPGTECGARIITAMTRVEFAERPATKQVVEALQQVFAEPAYDKPASNGPA